MLSLKVSYALVSCYVLTLVELVFTYPDSTVYSDPYSGAQKVKLIPTSVN